MHKLFFYYTHDKSDADIVIEFNEHSSKNHFKFDGPGGELAVTEKGFITLDQSETWLL